MLAQPLACPGPAVNLRSMPAAREHRVIRDPLWNTIRIDAVAMRIIDTPAFQRLRYIRQLGHAHLVYPGATHTRFDHAIGVYHLAVTALRLLRDAQEHESSAWEGAELIPYAALLHDIGHYAFSHALEELEGGRVPADHEEVSIRFFQSSELALALEPLGADAPERIYALIRGQSALPLRGLVAGSLDLDKMEYLRRDALFCGVPYGEVDVDRLLQGLLLLRDPVTGATEVGIDEKAISALESLLFAKYQMFRNVYWHHAVRSATALYKRIIDAALLVGLVAADELVGPTDEELLALVGQRAEARVDDDVARRLRRRWLPALRARRLPKRAAELNAADIDPEALPAWVGADSRIKRAVEDEWARELGLEPGEVFVDFPAKPSMFQLSVLVRRASGQVRRLDASGIPGLIDLPRIARELYRTARVLRVFTFERRTIDRADVLRRIRPV
jgi:HD superfamily phosphohydrolase